MTFLSAVGGAFLFVVGFLVIDQALSEPAWVNPDAGIFRGAVFMAVGAALLIVAAVLAATKKK